MAEEQAEGEKDWVVETEREAEVQREMVPLGLTVLVGEEERLADTELLVVGEAAEEGEEEGEPDSQEDTETDRVPLKEPVEQGEEELDGVTGPVSVVEEEDEPDREPVIEGVRLAVGQLDGDSVLLTDQELQGDTDPLVEGEVEGDSVLLRVPVLHPDGEPDKDEEVVHDWQGEGEADGEPDNEVVKLKVGLAEGDMVPLRDDV